MGIINCESVCLHYGTNEILNNITLNINPGSKVGVIGVNGAGKSTLFRILTGELEATSGAVRIQQKASIGILEQYTDSADECRTVFETALLPFSEQAATEARLDILSEKLESNTASDAEIAQYTDLTERFKTIGGYEYKAKAKSYINKLGFADDTFDREVKTLSGGQKTRLALAALLLTEHDIYLLDEPTNHLDTDSIEWLEDLISASKKTFLIISHDRYFLDKVTKETIEIENTKCMMYEGSYTLFKEKKKKLLEDQQKHYELQQHEIKRMEEFIANQRKWNRERNIIAAESRQKAIDRMVKIEKVAAPPKAINFRIAASSAQGTDVLYVKELEKSYNGKVILKHLTLEVKKNDRLFILGPNGSGKSTFMKILTGREKSDSGSYYFGYNQKIGYYDQEQQQLNEASTVINELWDKHPEMTQTEIRKYLASFNFTGDDIFKEITVLSGGERARLTIAKLILDKISVLILDEPTNHLDINSREVLEAALNEFDGTVICVSHDRYFIKSLATKIFELCPYSPFTGYKLFKCGYDDYISQKTNIVTDECQSDRTVNEYFEQKKLRSDQKKKETAIKKTEEKILALENSLALIDKKISDNGQDYLLLDALYKERVQIEEELNGLYTLLSELC